MGHRGWKWIIITITSVQRLFESTEVSVSLVGFLTGEHFSSTTSIAREESTEILPENTLSSLRLLRIPLEGISFFAPTAIKSKSILIVRE